MEAWERSYNFAHLHSVLYLWVAKEIISAANIARGVSGLLGTCCMYIT